MNKENKFILWFNEIGIEDIPLVGGKNASLGEMYKSLTKKGVNIPNGFAVTANAYRYFLEEEHIREELKGILSKVNVRSVESLAVIGHEARQLILKADLPPPLRISIIEAYRKLCRKYGKNCDVAVRSSATAEDLPSISEDSHALIKVNGKPVYDTIKNIYQRFGRGTDATVEVVAMEDNRLKWVKAEQIYIHPAKDKKLYKITTETGREITVTKNHSLIILDPENLEPKAVSIQELKGGEMVPVTKKIPPLNIGVKKVNVLDYVKGNDVHSEGGLVYIKSDSLNWKIQNPLKDDINVDTDFAYFLGLYCAEGSTYKNNCVMLTNADKNVIRKIKLFLEKMSLYNGQRINKNSLRIHCKCFVRFLHSVTGKPLNVKGKGRSCKIKKVPNFIFGCNKAIISSFLKGCFDGDGFISTKGIEYSSTSELLIGGIIKLLEMLEIDSYIRRKKTSFEINIPVSQAKKFKESIGLEHTQKLKRLNKLIKSYSKKEKHPEFKNTLLISECLSKNIKSAYDDLLEKQLVEVRICPLCNNNIEKTSYYKGRLRYYCRNCKKAFYESEVKKQNVKKYVYYDEKGRFKKNSIPWNKCLISGNISRNVFTRLMKRNKLDEYANIFENDVIWDKIKEVHEYDYKGMVYDFTVPGIENFAAGIGGIITHNSASFAGQQETYLNIRGEHTLIDSCKKCFASLFTNRAIHYRMDKGFDHFKVALSIGVQKMVRSDLGASGVMFSIDTETGFKDVVLIDAIYGLGENIVQGAVNPDEYYVFKPTLKKGYNSIISKVVGNKNLKMVYSLGGSKETTKNVSVSLEDRKKFVLDDKEMLKLAEWACIVEEHYKKPMDMEWAKDGKTGKLFMVQARPETVQSQKDMNVLEEYVINKKGKVLTIGRSVGSKIGQGRAQIIKDVHNIKKFKGGEILVTEMTDPDWEPIMKIASGIVTNKGGKTCHAAIVSRELGIPCIVGTNDATHKVRNNQKITISCAEGEEGFVYEDYIPFKVNRHNLKNFKRPHTRVMMNVGNPEQAFEFSFIPNDGVGLAREEFIINEYIKIHPKALIHFNLIKDDKIKEKIEKLTIGYRDKKQFFIDKLAYGVAMIGAAFYPKDVIVRMSDFKSNEYANLIGGEMFEPIEHNPMIGWRGASRYYSANYREAFALECKAMKKVREEMGLTNVKLMVPFCRTVEEGKKVLKEMEKNGLVRGKKGLQVYVMCEIPSNVILADEFSKIFDGFSIGTNDLTQLTLGLDRDSELVSHVYDERNMAVKTLVASVIHKAKANRRKIGICGEAGSIPEFAQFLVSCGIDSISVVPDAAIKTSLVVLEAERKLKKKY